MKENKLNQNDEYLYLPYPNEKFPPIKVFFAYKRITQNGKDFNIQYIFVKDKSTLSKYPDLETYETACKSINLDLTLFVIEEHLDYIFPYSDKLLNSSIRMFTYFNKYQYKYKKFLRYSKLYLSKNEGFYWSNDYYKIKKHPIIYKFFCLKKILWFSIIGTLKKPLYIVIFFLDIIKSSISTYKKYKDKEADVKFYNSLEGHYSFLSKPRSEIEAEKKKDIEELEEIKEKYITSNITLFTLLIALFTLLFSIISNYFILKTNNKTLTQKDEIIINIQNENLSLKNELELEKKSSEILKLLIQSNISNEIDLESLNNKFNDELSQKVSINELQKLLDNK